MNEINTKRTLTSWFFHSYHQESVTDANEPVEREFQIRVAVPDDLSSVAQIIAESFHSQHGIWGWAFPMLRLGIYEDLKHRLVSPAPHHICLVAVDTTNNVVGTVEMGARFSNSWAPLGRSFPYLSNLAVCPKYRRHGVASGLLTQCEHISGEWGFQDLYLHVVENNHQARHLYFKQGYRVHKIESSWNIFLLRYSHQLLLHKCLKAN